MQTQINHPQDRARLQSIVDRVHALAVAAGDEGAADLDGFIEWSDEAEAFGVMVGCGGASGYDIVGAGWTVQAAMADAESTVSKWEAAK